MDMFLTLLNGNEAIGSCEDLWVPYLIGALPSDVTSSLPKEPKWDVCGRDYYFEMRAYFEGWLNELEIGSFDGLKNLMITDKMKKMLSRVGPRRHVKASETVNDEKDRYHSGKLERPPKREYFHQVPNEIPLRCYDCGKQGVIKSRCPTCNLNA
ncbi:uncharacterized protein TNCV_3215901 [Trichonephila clavipes]|nr:uncharacterized protein TNCV_3215901 [Trichonephila clavipes]